VGTTRRLSGFTQVTAVPRWLPPLGDAQSYSHGYQDSQRFQFGVGVTSTATQGNGSISGRAPRGARDTVLPPDTRLSDELHRQVLYIQQAAQLVGASAVQLRKWEQQHLISPARTPSGYRTYTLADIERMRRIQSLMVGGVNAEGVRRILDQSGDVARNGAAASPGSAHSRHAAVTIRDLRKGRKLTLRDVATMTGLSPSYISAVERGTAVPSIASLQKIGAAFDTNVLGLMSESYEPPNLLVRAHSRRILDSDKGVRIEDMSTAGSNLEPLLFTFEPGCGSDGAISHEGEEFLFVMSGQLHLRLDGSDDYLLGPGDSMAFRSERAHEFGNPNGPGPTTVLWINTPRTF
jgi:DNA-binding transcriptional MerR regulator/quercetin dioxygenase-like cupin family protein